MIFEEENLEDPFMNKKVEIKSEKSNEVTEISMPNRAQHTELVWKNLEVKAGKKILLNGVSGKACSGEMIALMGSSGAGKSTLMNTLNGRSNLSLSGDIYLNSQPISNVDWKHISAYVQQEFHAYGKQTVLETLQFAHDTKFPRNRSAEKTNSEMIKFLKFLGLIHVKDEYVEGLSGGEQRRLYVGIELIGDPSVIFLDEPLSGLDSYNADKILIFLRDLAKKQNKTIIVTIHQPSYKMLEYFDKLHLLANKEVVFHGKVTDCLEFFARNGFNLPENTNPADFFLETLSIDYTTDKTTQESLKRIDILHKSWKKSNESKPDIACKDKIKNRNTRDGLKYSFFIIFVMLRRFITNRFRNMKNLLLNKIFGTSLQVGLIYLILGGKNDQGHYEATNVFLTLLYFSISQLYLFSSRIFNEFEFDKKIYTREIRSGMYNSFSFYYCRFLSDFTFNGIFELIGTTALLLRTEFFISFSEYLHSVLLLCLSIFVSCNTVMCITIVISDIDLSQLTTLLVNASYMVFNAFIALLVENGNEMHNDTSAFTKIASVFPFFYISKAFLENKLANSTIAVTIYQNMPPIIMDGTEFVKSKKLSEINQFIGLIIAFAYGLVFSLVGTISIWRQTRLKHIK